MSNATSNPYSRAYSASVSSLRRTPVAVQTPLAPSGQATREGTFSFSSQNESEKQPFWEKHKLWLLGGVGVATVAGVIYWSRKR